MKKIVVLFTILLLNGLTVYSAHVNYWPDGSIRSIGGKQVQYWPDGSIRSIDD